MSREVRLYFAPRSFSSQIARLSLVEKRVKFHTRVVDIYREEHFAPWYARLNPNLYVPTLQHGEELITDCHRIARYVDETFDGPPLTPSDPSDLTLMESLIDLQVGIREKELTLSCAGDKSAAEFVSRKVKRLEALIDEEGECVDVFKAKLKEWYELGHAVSQSGLAAALNNDVDSALARLTEQLKQGADEIGYCTFDLHCSFLSSKQGRAWFRSDATKLIQSSVRACLTDSDPISPLLLTPLVCRISPVETLGPYLLGNCYSLADIVWTVLLARLCRLGLSTKFDASTLPLVSRYYANLQKRPSFCQAEIS